MQLALENRCTTIAFPAISCGVYGYPWALAANVSMQAVAASLRKNSAIQLVRWVLFGDEIFETWQRAATFVGASD
jgi:O-acetyl-ADP-ribose deacetylase (regulator of RNase III)